MRVEFDDDDLDRLETDPAFTMGLAGALVRAYRKRLQVIRSAPDERDFYALKSLHYERLKGQLQQRRSMRLNEQFRLVLEIRGTGAEKRVRILGIEDYH
jgi:proteic killer suppression protein